MTNENYTILSNNEILEQVRLIHVGFSNLEKVLRKRNSSLLESIVERTKFLDDYFSSKNYNVPIKARLYCLEHDLKCHPKCQNPECTNLVGWNGSEFSRHCCNRCINHDVKVIEKMRATWENKSEDEISAIKQKSKNKCIEKYDCEFPTQSEKVKHKTRNTVKDRYGVEHISQAQFVKDAKREKSLERFGVECVFQSEEIKHKIRDKLNEQHNVDYVMQIQEVKDKSKSTHDERYGGIGFASEYLAKKSRTTINDRLGVDCAFQSEEVKRKIKDKMKSKYGVEYYSQTSEFHQKCSKPYTNPKYPDMTFATSWEFKVYDFLTEHNILFEYQPKISFPYEYEGTHHTYHPDFRVGDRIVEVKGDHFFRFNENTKAEEMFCPYRRPEWTNEYYDWMCGLYEAKHQCMLKNNVVILRFNDVENLAIEMFN